MSVVINGSAGVTTNSGAVYNGIAAGTAVASTSGTSIDFTGIPSWVKRVTVIFNNVSPSATASLQVQLGTSSGVETTGYSSNCGSSGGGTQFNAGSAITTGFLLYNQTGASASFNCQLVLTNISGNIWIGSVSGVETGRCLAGGGSKTTSATLDRVRITTTSTDTFDAGSINILYE